MEEWLKGKKTYIVSGLMVLVGVVRALSGDMGWVEFMTSADVMVLLNGVGIGTLRAGMAKK